MKEYKKGLLFCWPAWQALKGQGEGKGGIWARQSAWGARGLVLGSNSLPFPSQAA